MAMAELDDQRAQGEGPARAFYVGNPALHAIQWSKCAVFESNCV